MILNEQLEYKGDLFPSKIINYTKEIDTLHFSSENNVILQLTVLRDSVLRFRYTTVGKFNNDFSYAISKNANTGYNNLEITEDDEKYIVTTSKLICNIYKSDLRKTIYDIKDNSVILEDEKGFHWEESYELGGDIVKMSKSAQSGESYYGLGDKPEHLNLKGKRFENWATDSYAFGKNTDPIYKAIPFYTGLHHGKSYGVFFDNTFKTYFDFCHERRNVTSFWAQGGEMNYYFIYGPKMQDVVTSYTDLTGKQPLPPRWALGNFASRMGYHSEKETRATVQKFEEKNIPLDAVIIDLYWFGKELLGTMGNLEFYKDSFPTPKKMIADFKKKGVKTVLITEPFILTSSKKWKEVAEKNLLGKDSLGNPYKYNFYFGETGIIDIYNPSAKKWFWNIYKKFITDYGVAGWWGDLGEPEVHPSDLLHETGTADEVHNIYGLDWAKLVFEGYQQDFPKQRPFILMSAGYSGSQRYGMIPWSGDVNRTWGGLQAQPEIALQMSMQGMAYMHSDLGGFAGVKS